MTFKNQWLASQVTYLKILVVFILKEVNQAATIAKDKVADLFGIISSGFRSVSTTFSKQLSDLADYSSPDYHSVPGPFGGSGHS